MVLHFQDGASGAILRVDLLIPDSRGRVFHTATISPNCREFCNSSHGGVVGPNASPTFVPITRHLLGIGGRFDLAGGPPDPATAAPGFSVLGQLEHT